MRKRKLLTIFSSVSALTLPLTTLSCGREVKSAAKIEQENRLADKSNATAVEQNWTQATLFFLYDIKAQSNNYDVYAKAYEEKFKDQNSKLFKDSYDAFQIYAKNKLKDDSFYFVKQNTTWISNSYFDAQQLKSLPSIIQQNWVPNQDIFSIWWSANQTKIRDEIEKMLFVKFYFAINNQEKLKKIDESFKYTADSLKYELQNYLLIKYALEKKIVQLWQKSDSNSADEDDFFIKGYALVQGANEDAVAKSFNSFMTGSDKSKKFDRQSELLVNYPGMSILDKLDGYQGFIAAPNDVKLAWDYETLKDKQKIQMYGFYDPNREILINPDNIASLTNGYNPYKSDAATNNVPEIVYLNQIAPIGAKNKTNLPIDEKDDKKTKDVQLLTFKDTIFENNLDKLAYMFYILDNDLYNKATTAFAKLGYKLSFNKEGNSVKDVVKDKPFVKE